MRALFLLAILLPLAPLAQEKCLTNYIPANKSRIEGSSQFEPWLRQRIAMRENTALLRAQQTIYEIPVAFHIIHTGTSIGTGANIAEERILEQLEILNQDFRRLNEDAEDTPTEFLPVAVDTEIQFVMARQDPEGLPTTGIVRKQGSKNEYQRMDDALLKSESFWPPEDYLNIYVANLPDGNLGYAQYPFSNLPGIESQLQNYRLTEGVVLDYEWVGLNENSPGFESKGRTATHEIGHFLGLRHVWGDGGCSFDDYCADTPQAGSSSTGCPTSKETCDSRDMIQNYMDYTHDRCMNLFTGCQKQRMQAVLEASPRRVSLLSSHALNDPVITANDLGIKAINSPTQDDCSQSTIPQLQVRNYGTNPITSFTIRVYSNDVLAEEKSWNQPLQPLELTTVSFSALALMHDQDQEVRFEITEVNEGADGNALNNASSIALSPFQSLVVPYFEDFESDNAIYRKTEHGNTSNWLFATAPDSLASNQAAYLPFYNQTQNFGFQDILLTQMLDFSALTSVQLTFRYAYAPRLIENDPNGIYYLDGFIVAISTNCGADFEVTDYLFERYGSHLRTANTTASSFTPAASSHWEEISLNLTNHTGHENVQIAFIGINGGGNNLYLDNIRITSANLKAYDLGVRSVDRMPVVTCQTSANPIVEVKNFGYERIQDLELDIRVNGAHATTYEFSGLNLLSGYTENLVTNIGNFLQTGTNQVVFEVTRINGLPDESPANNLRTYEVVLEESADVIPVKEDFEDMTWTLTSPNANAIYEVVDLGGNKALKANGFETTVAGIEGYLVTPDLYTARYHEASIRFRYSYAERPGFTDNLSLYYSVNCGRTFDEVIWSNNSEQLAVTSSTEPWEPQSAEDWREVFIDITSLLVWEDLRFAFVFQNGNGNNLYLDDIRIKTSADPNLPDPEGLMSVYPNPSSGTFHIHFELPEKQPVEIRLIDLSGSVVYKKLLPHTLDQRYEMEVSVKTGMYFLQAIGKNFRDVKRLYIGQ